MKSFGHGYTTAGQAHTGTDPLGKVTYRLGGDLRSEEWRGRETTPQREVYPKQAHDTSSPFAPHAGSCYL